MVAVGTFIAEQKWGLDEIPQCYIVDHTKWPFCHPICESITAEITGGVQDVTTTLCRQGEVMKYSNMLTPVFDLNMFGMQF